MNTPQVTEQELQTYKLMYAQILSACKHIFKREGIKVVCHKCGLEYVDVEQKFPIEEANK